jgi:hypothetical protein
MIVQVWHQEQDTGHVHVADVYIPDHAFTSDLSACEPVSHAACETAYMFTQNIMGSWSVGPEYADGTLNEDYNPAVTRVVALPVYNGKQCGLRSSMMGDIFSINGVHYLCRSFGFKRIETGAAHAALLS